MSARQTPLDEYLSLVRAFPLVSIRDDAYLKEALAAIDVMLDLPHRSEAQETYLSALTDLVETYETAHVVFPPRTGLDALRFLMESNELRQEDLAPIFGTKSVVSEVLNERRERKLTLEHVKKLAAYFHVSPAVFIDDARCHGKRRMTGRVKPGTTSSPSSWSASPSVTTGSRSSRRHTST